jgi:hypothetical protein
VEFWIRQLQNKAGKMKKTNPWKMMALLALVAVFGSLCSGTASPVWAEIYKYVDDRGQMHFVDSIDKVPPEYLDEVASRPGSKTDATPSPPSRPPTIPKPDETKPTGNARIIPYKITSHTWNAAQKRSVPTPQAVIEKIHAVLRLWQSVPEANLQFHYAGLAGSSYSSREELPNDGTLYFILNGDHPFGNMVAGAGGYSGTIPEDYRKGFVFLNTKAGLYTMKFKTLIHETGHALGISGHSVNIASIMSCGTPSWSGHEFLTFAEQDRANFIHVWNPPAVPTISGTVSGPDKKFVYVHAVNVLNGNTFSSMSNHQGNFSIPIGATGNYRIFAKGFESSAFDKPVGQSPSWYVSQGHSTNDPAGGKVFPIAGPDSRVEGLQLAMIERPVPFNFFWSLTVPTSSSEPVATFVPSFLRPGHEVRFKLVYNGGGIRQVEPYGRKPDYEVKAFDPNSRMITIQAHPNAIPGHRLLIARGDTGTVQAGLVGLHVIRSEFPGYISAKIEEQIAGPVDFSGLNPHFWK